MTDHQVRMLRTDAEFTMHSTRLFLHLWPFLAGAAALTHVLSTETGLLVTYGVPYWILGAVLLGSGALLIAGRISKWWPLFAIADITAGTLCLMMAVMMASAAMRGHASALSVMLWLLPGLLYEVQSVVRARYK